MVKPYVKVGEAAISIQVGNIIKDQIAPTLPPVEKAIASIIGWILILVNLVWGAEGAIEIFGGAWAKGKAKAMGSQGS